MAVLPRSGSAGPWLGQWWRSAPHPDAALEMPWRWLQGGLLLLPFSITLGGLGCGIALGWGTRSLGRRLWARPHNWGWLALALGLGLTASLGEDPGVAWVGLANFVPCFWFFAVTRELVRDPAQLRRLAWIQVLSAGAIGVIGLLPLVGWFAGPVNLSIFIQWPLELGGTPPGRMAGVFAYANVLASYFTVTLALGLGLWLEAWQRWQHQRLTSTPLIPTGLIPTRLIPTGLIPTRLIPTTKGAGTKGAGTKGAGTAEISTPLPWALNPTQTLGWLTLVLLIQGVGLGLTQSRNAWGVGLLLGLIYGIRLGWYQGVAALVAALATVLWAAFGSVGQRLAQGVVPRMVWARLNDQLYGDRPVADLRISQWRFAWAMTCDRPWTGWGLRNFTPLYEAATDHWLGHPHNLLLMLTAETGIPVTLGFLGLVGWILGRGVMQWRTLVPGKRGSRGLGTQPRDRGGQNAAAQPETATDTATHTEPDAGTDIEPDTEPNTEPNTEPDTEPDTEPHTGTNTGTQTEPDTGAEILLTYLLAFGGCVLFNGLDITLFDYRINLINWLLLAAIAGFRPKKPWGIINRATDP